MTIKDNAELAPKKDNQEPAPEIAVVVPEKATVSPEPKPQVEDKYKDKTLEEVIEMHRNVESLSTKVAMENAELKKAAKLPEPSVADIAKLFAPEPSSDEDNPVSKDIAEVKASAVATNIKLAVLEARADGTMPEWKEDEGRILEIAKVKPYMLYSPTWTKDIYSLVQAEKLPAKLQAAEERGKKLMDTQDAEKIKASAISSSGVKPPAPAPALTFAEISKQYRQGKITLEEYTKATFNDAEKGNK